MSRQRRYISVFLALVTLLILGFVVAVASRSRPGGLGDDPLFDFDARLDIDLAGLAAWIIFILAIVGAVLLVFGIKEAKPRREARKRNYLGVLLGIAVFFLIFRIFQPVADTLLGAAESGEAGEAAGEPGAAGGGPIGWLFSLLVAAVVAAALTRVGLSVREAGFDDIDDEVAPTRPAFAVAAVPAALPLDNDPRSRVLSSYHRFEEAAADLDLARRRNETAKRHAQRVRDEAHLSEAGVAGLMAQFARARFGLASITDEDAEAAEDLSQRLRMEMGR